MIANLLLFPYWVTLKVRHLLYDKGIKKTYRPSVPSVCIGNITVGGTGKTPHTEMILRTLLEQEEWFGKNIAVLSRGYKRKSKGFQQVPADGRAIDFGDEPVQIKKKFPMVTVAVDASRKDGCTFLTDPDLVKTSKKGRRCIHKDFPKADAIVLDDAFQHRAVKANVNIVLVDFNRPIFKDHLMPLGRLRDLPSRIKAADIVIYNLPVRLSELDLLGKADFIEDKAKHILEANYRNPSFGKDLIQKLKGIHPAMEYTPGETWLMLQALTGYEIFTGEKPDLEKMTACL